MASLAEIRQRLDNLGTIEHLIRSMRAMSAIRWRRARSSLEAAQRYADYVRRQLSLAVSYPTALVRAGARARPTPRSQRARTGPYGPMGGRRPQRGWGPPPCLAGPRGPARAPGIVYHSATSESSTLLIGRGHGLRRPHGGSGREGRSPTGPIARRRLPSCPLRQGPLLSCVRGLPCE